MKAITKKVIVLYKFVRGDTVQLRPTSLADFQALQDRSVPKNIWDIIVSWYSGQSAVVVNVCENGYQLDIDSQLYLWPESALVATGKPTRKIKFRIGDKVKIIGQETGIKTVAAITSEGNRFFLLGEHGTYKDSELKHVSSEMQDFINSYPINTN